MLQTSSDRYPHLDSLAEQGFIIVPSLLNGSECQELIDQLGPVPGAGRRGLLKLPIIANLACSEKLLGLVRPHLTLEPRPVRGIYFDKNPETNWMVAWHQDLTIAVRGQNNVPGFEPWSVKEGVHHVQPPVHLLEQMMTIRLHLDDCQEENGALRVIPGSHRSGRLSADAIQHLRDKEPATVCTVPAGGALLMRPLLLHSSGRSSTRGHRRVIHIEYAGVDLPGGLHWHEAPYRAH